MGFDGGSSGLLQDATKKITKTQSIGTRGLFNCLKKLMICTFLHLYFNR